MKKLTDLEPRWVGGFHGGPERHGTGIGFICPHCQTRLVVYFANPVDGGPPLEATYVNEEGKTVRCHLWTRAGETFETLTLSPSINAAPQGHWHGHIINGIVTP